MTTRFAHSLFTWTCLLLLGAASFLRPGMVLCISDHGHVRVETNCASACEELCVDSCEQASQPTSHAGSTSNGCRDVPLEFDTTSPTRTDKGAPQVAAQLDLPVAILSVPLAVSRGSIFAFTADDGEPRPRAALGRLRMIVLQV